MPKDCDKCAQPFKGFGSTCGPCRKGGKDAGPPRACDQCGTFFVGATPVCPECAKGKGLGRTGVRLPTVEEVDDALSRIQSSIEKVDAANGQNVKLKKAENNLLVQLEIVRDITQRIIESRSKPLLISVFGDCSRVAQLECFLESVRLSEANMLDNRFKNCFKALESITQIVEDDLGARLQLAQARETAAGELIKKRVSFLMDAEKVAEAQQTTADLQIQSAFGGDYASAYAQRQGEDDNMQSGYATQDGDEDASDWSDEDMEEMDQGYADALLEHNAKTLFDALDEDGDGELTRDEFDNGKQGLLGLLKACRIRKRKHIIKMFNEGDADGNGTISFDEFIAYIKSARSKAIAAAPKEIDDRKVQRIFDLMDRDGDGSITREELKLAYAGVLLMAGEPVDSKRVSSWARRNFKKYDEDGSGAIDLGEFKKLLSHSGALMPMLDLHPDAQRVALMARE